MADHLFRKSWGSSGFVAIVVAVVVLLLCAPARARADVAVTVPAVSVSVPAVSVTAPPASVSVPAVSVSVPAVSVSVPVVHTPPPAVASPAVLAAPSAPQSTSQPSPVPSAQPAIVTATAPHPVHVRAAARTPARIRTRPSRRNRRHEITRRSASAPAVVSRAVAWSDSPQPAAAVARRTVGRPHTRRDTRDSPRPGVRADRRPPATTSAMVRLPAPASLPPAGAEGAAGGGAAGAAGAGTAALLVLIALYGMRALLPELLALELGQWRSALLVSSLERPG
jgi:hypothetical protein